MGIINVLPEEVILKIAAGEVIERPASVVKELIENSMDAGASDILVELKGLDLRILDNGKGMEEDDLKVCHLRHSTSKIKLAEDLFDVHSLGFRGEALASISAISLMQVTTKVKGETANSMIIEGGQVKSIKPSSFPSEHGTEISVKNLFYNTPVRKKFMKTDGTEVRAIVELISQYIFNNDNVSFKLIVDGKTALYSPAGNLMQKFYNIYGKESKEMLEFNDEESDLTISGLISKPSLARKSRFDQIIFVNGRLVKSKIVYVAITNAYKGYLNIGEQPVVIIKIETAPNKVDVNVHPTKQEVKFQDEHVIYSLVYHAIKNKLLSCDLTKKVNVDDGETEKTLANFSSSSETKAVVPEKINLVNVSSSTPSNFNDLNKIPSRKVTEQFIFADSSDKEESLVSTSSNIKTVPIISQSSYIETTSHFENTKDLGNKVLINSYKILGIFDKEFLLVEKYLENSQSSLVVVDFHAAAEIVNYYKFHKQYSEGVIQTQALVQPEIIEVSPAIAHIISHNIGAFKQLGFFMDEFGKNSFILRTIPVLLGKDVDSKLVIDLAEEFAAEEKINSLVDKHDKVITRMACRASEKAGDDLTVVQAKKILDELFELQGNKYNCPHGRPTIIEFSKKDLEKMFKRIL